MDPIGVAFLVAAFAFIVVVVVIFLGGGKKKELLAKVEAARSSALENLASLEALSARYWVDDMLSFFRERMHRERSLQGRSSSSEELKNLAEWYDGISAEVDVYLKNPAAKLRKKYYDPLDDLPLSDPVDLLLVHPEKGHVAMKVNRRNRDLFLKYGPVYFQRRQVTYVTTHEYYAVGAGFGNDYALISYLLLEDLFFDQQAGCMFSDVQPFMGQGGQFNGGGANLDWVDPSQIGQVDADGNWQPEPLETSVPDSVSVAGVFQQDDAPAPEDVSAAQAQDMGDQDDPAASDNQQQDDEKDDPADTEVADSPDESPDTGSFDSTE